MAHPIDPSAYAVDSGQLDLHSKDIHAVATEIDTLMMTMSRKLDVLQGSWKGKAAGQYAALHSDWERAQGQVRNTLTDIGVAVGSAGSAYAQVEGDIASAFTPR